ncbi:3,4-dihydroxy-2-butanone-4-phosphate synthase [Kitasatospora camelliae]|uniref:3,4-dihydroxy-2-butanone 4-phosphate synthase n=1 Tax=Kitasatospora camelliae TaxID=3156397 RepID=A0AAU8JYD7_9ACTN
MAMIEAVEAVEVVEAVGSVEVRVDPDGRSAAERIAEVERAVEAFARGGFVIVFDDESRENEGDLVVAAEHTTEAAMRYLLENTSGVVCVAVPDRVAAALELPQMTEVNSGLHETAFTVSVDLRPGGTTGISAAERSRTVQALADPATRPEDLGRPGHVFPIRAVPGGVLARDGHTEAAVDLSRLAGLSGAAAICEIVRPDWGMARLPDLVRLAERDGLPLISVGDLAAYRRATGR